MDDLGWLIKSLIWSFWFYSSLDCLSNFLFNRSIFSSYSAIYYSSLSWYFFILLICSCYSTSFWSSCASSKILYPYYCYISSLNEFIFSFNFSLSSTLSCLVYSSSYLRFSILYLYFLLTLSYFSSFLSSLCSIF